MQDGELPVALGAELSASHVYIIHLEQPQTQSKRAWGLRDLNTFKHVHLFLCQHIKIINYRDLYCEMQCIHKRKKKNCN